MPGQRRSTLRSTGGRRPSAALALVPETDDLADLAASLRAAMPMPELPSGGRTEVRAAALAVRGAKRRDRARLLVAAAVTLVVGVVGGAALSSAVQQQSPTTDQAAVQVDLDYASGYLAKNDSAKARQYIERASKAMLGKTPAPPGSAPVDGQRDRSDRRAEAGAGRPGGARHQAGGPERQAEQGFGFDDTHCARPMCQSPPRASTSYHDRAATTRRPVRYL